MEKFEALVDEFENRLNELKNEALEGQQQFFRNIEDLEEKFSSGTSIWQSFSFLLSIPCISIISFYLFSSNFVVYILLYTPFS